MQIYQRSSRELFELPDDLLGEERRAENVELFEAARLWLSSELTREVELAAEFWRETTPALSLDPQLVALCSRVRKKHYSFIVVEYIQCDSIDALANMKAQCPLPLLSEIQQRVKLPDQKALATLVRSHMRSNAAPPALTKADEFGLARIDPVSNLVFLARVAVSTEYVIPIESVGNLHDRAWSVLYDLSSGLYNHFALGRHASMVPGLVQAVTLSSFRASRASVSALARKAAAASAAAQATGSAQSPNPLSSETPAETSPESAAEVEIAPHEPAPLPPLTDIRETLQRLSAAQEPLTHVPAEAFAEAPKGAQTPPRGADEHQGFRAALSALWNKVRGQKSDPSPSVSEQSRDLTGSQL
ncbi:MAG: hypothetical protein U0Q16_09525 [Bryobacteraceae bacterium]